jgi:hypothetical protein
MPDYTDAHGKASFLSCVAASAIDIGISRIESGYIGD